MSIYHNRILAFSGDRQDDIETAAAHVDWYDVTVRDGARDELELTRGQMDALEAQLDAALSKLECVRDEIERECEGA